MLYLLKAEVRNKVLIDFLIKIDLFLGGESEQNASPMDIHGTGNANELQDSQSNPNIIHTIRKSYITPKIWMDFDDFCSCFTSIVVFHNPRGYQYTQKHTEIKVKYL